ncbi:MAG: HAD family hydrolase, partial [Pseudomonadota bacterium]
MATRIKAALFDKDGTLIDFTASWRGLVDDMIAEYAGADEGLANAIGAAIGYDRATGVFLPGSPIVADTTDVIAQIMAELLPGRSAAEIEDDANRRAAAAGAGDASGVAPVAGLLEALEALDAMGVAIGVGTHDSEAAARTQTKGMGVSHLIRFYAGYDSGHGLKPGPGMPNAFARHCGVDPSEIVMVGDSVHDLGAGRAA